MDLEKELKKYKKKVETDAKRIEALEEKIEGLRQIDKINTALIITILKEAGCIGKDKAMVIKREEVGKTAETMQPMALVDYDDDKKTYSMYIQEAGD